MAVAPLTGARRLRELLQRPDSIVSAPGVFDGFTARLALALDFEALYMVCRSQCQHNEQTLTRVDGRRYLDFTHGLG